MVGGLAMNPQANKDWALEDITRLFVFLVPSP
jgi:hypothetical protein